MTNFQLTQEILKASLEVLPPGPPSGLCPGPSSGFFRPLAFYKLSLEQKISVMTKCLEKPLKEKNSIKSFGLF